MTIEHGAAARALDCRREHISHYFLLGGISVEKQTRAKLLIRDVSRTS